MDTRKLKVIGRGAFSTAFEHHTDKRKVLIKSRDRVKDCMAEGFFPEHRLFPTVTRVAQGDTFSFYEMERYERTTGLKAHLTDRQWRLYKALREAYASPVRTAWSLMDATIQRITTLPAEFKTEKDAILEAIYGLSNYSTDIAFEISPRNVAVKGKKLILLDVFFIRSDLR